MNVMINLPGVEDESYCNEKKNAVNDLIEKAKSLHQVVFEKTMNGINK
jgi:formiminotetrahydrofolate cyclodeaminase